MHDVPAPQGERRAARSARVARRQAVRRHLFSRAALAMVAVSGLAGTAMLAPIGGPVASDPATRTAASAELQSLDVTAAPAPASGGESYVAATGPETLIDGGTNHDWAKLVLVDGGWPITEDNVAVITRWMRQENGPDNWWNRNNPLNNGYGSGGGSGLGSYDSLVDAAQYAADNLKARDFYTDIVAGLERGDDADATAAAIWASPWASSHYGNGTHWSTTPVPVVQAPADAW